MKQKSIAMAALTLLAFICAGCLYDVVELPDPVLLVEPYITVQPETQSLTVGATPPTALRVEIDEWTPQDGTLSYQWYKFDNYFAYLTNGADKIPDATTDVLTLSGLKTAAGARNYFFVEITNFNPIATNKQTATIRSEVAVISFNAAGAPAIPIITRHPANTQARFGRPVSPLSVRATVNALPAQTGELTYQWYSIDTEEGPDGEIVIKDDDHDGIPNATPVPGETASEFVPVASSLGYSYFYVEVTHTLEGVSTSEISFPAIVDILRGLRAGTPVINSQPKAALYFAGNPAAPMTVEAESPDFGALTFQWYSNSRPASSGGTLVATHTDADTEDLELEDKRGRRSSYTPEFPASGSSSAFYYVLVTNYNTNVEGAVTAAASTRAVSIRRQTTAAPASGNMVVTVNDPTVPSNVFNYVRGYGGMEVAWANFPETFPEETELQYDPDRLGFNILRIMMPVSNTNIDIAMDELVNITGRRPHYYDNVKIVNKYGGYVLASPWSPPKEWKSNNSINGGGILRYEYYAQYAAYLRSFAMHMNNRGAPIYSISIQNEPNYSAGYDGCEWTGDEMMAFYRDHGRYTDGVRGWGGGKQTPRVLTMNGESANTPYINRAAIDNPVAYANIDMFARHVYGDRTQNLWVDRPIVRKSYRDDSGKDVWMTEHNINSANAAGYYNDSKWDYIWKFMNDIDLVMRLNNENGFVWWASKRFYSMVGDGQYGTPNGQALPRGWGLSHYSKYTIDTTRIGTTITGVTANGSPAADEVNTDGSDNSPKGKDMDNVSARITAYMSQDGAEISLVMWTPISPTTNTSCLDMGTIQINMPNGFDIGSATGIRSYKVNETTNAYHEPEDVLVSSNRRSAFVTLPVNQIVSVKFTKTE
jgi:O-glycosyl hydrolase